MKSDSNAGGDVLPQRPFQRKVEKYTLVNLLRIILSAATTAISFYYDLPVIQGFFVAHLAFSVLWFILVQSSLLVEPNHIWTGFVPLTLDVSFLSIYVYYTGSTGSFAIVVYVIITALSSLPTRFNFGIFAALFSAFAYTSVCLLVLLGYAPNVDIVGLKSDLTFLKFILSSTTLLISCVLVNKMIHGLMKEKEKLLLESREAHEKDIEISQRRFDHLVDNSTDILFQLDGELRFQAINSAMRRLLGHRQEEWIGKRFQDLIRQPQISLDNLAMQESLAILLKEKQRTSFKAELRTRLGDYLEMIVHLENVGFEEGDIIYGRATAILDDVLLKYLESEKQKFILDNSLSLTEHVMDRITKNVERYDSKEMVTHIRLCVKEMLINAVEHGNLEIDYELKTNVMASGDYLAFLLNRQNSEEYRTRKVKVESWLNSERVAYRITDDGAGFDHSKLFRKSIDEVNDGAELHGRGIVLTRSIFHIVRYNKKGNQVVLIRYFDNQST